MKLLFLVFIITLIVAIGCVELYEFKIKNDNPSLVIEGQISNVSFNEYQEFPADGRYFTVRLSKTSNVTNERDERVRNASVTLIDNKGNQWDYTSSEQNPGIYILYDNDFHAVQGIQYKLKVMLSDGESYESDWEQMPDVEQGSMGNIDFEEVVVQKYIYRANERVLTDVKGINTRVDLPKVHSDGPIFYKWTFSATWVFRASLVSATSDVYRCWITDPYYLSDYVTLRDYIGGYKNKLFFLQVDGNDRIFDRISVLICQYAVTEKYYNYWKEIQQQDESTGLFDPPPFNLQSNLHAENSDLEVYGYFGVVCEQGSRWDFNKNDLSYPVINTWRDYCTNPNILLPPDSKCYSCLNYGNGIPTNIKPSWWDE